MSIEGITENIEIDPTIQEPEPTIEDILSEVDEKETLLNDEKRSKRSGSRNKRREQSKGNDRSELSLSNIILISLLVVSLLISAICIIVLVIKKKKENKEEEPVNVKIKNKPETETYIAPRVYPQKKLNLNPETTFIQPPRELTNIEKQHLHDNLKNERNVNERSESTNRSGVEMNEMKRNVNGVERSVNEMNEIDERITGGNESKRREEYEESENVIIVEDEQRVNENEQRNKINESEEVKIDEIVVQDVDDMIEKPEIEYEVPFV